MYVPACSGALGGYAEVQEILNLLDFRSQLF